MKKIITMLLALMLVFMLTSVAFAAEAEGEMAESSISDVTLDVTENTSTDEPLTEETVTDAEDVTAEGEYETEIVEEKQDMSITAEGSLPDAEKFDIKAYLTEKIAPIVVGVATSLIALGGTIFKIKSSLSALDSSNENIKEIKKSAKDTLDNVKTELTRGMCDIQTKIKDIPEIKEGYEELKKNTEELSKQNRALLEALKLGFESLPEAVVSGNARKISIITEGVTDEK